MNLLQLLCLFLSVSYVISCRSTTSFHPLQTTPTITTTPSTTTSTTTTTPSTTTSTTTTTTSTTTPERVDCPNGWIDAQAQDLGCIIVPDITNLSWFDAHDVCQNQSSASLVEALSTEQAEFLFAD